MVTNRLTVAPGNEAQAQAWDGDEGELWARYPEFFEASTALHQRSLMAAATIDRHENVLDLGCGSGGSTIQAAEAASAGTAVGIDLSAKMLENARERARAQGVGNATFVQGDAQIYRFEPESFDVVISRTGAMFFSDQAAAFRNIAAATRPGGRLALVSWQGPDRNEWFRSLVDAMTLGRPPSPPPPDAPSPFAHADPARTQQIFTAAGFANVHSEPVELPMYFGETAAQAYEALSQLLAWLAGDLGPGERDRAFQNLRSSLQEHQTPTGVIYGSAVWVITAQRT